MSAIGHSVSVHAGAGTGLPPAGDVGIYLDVTAGSDADNGTSWAQAYLTWEKAESALYDILATKPTDQQITIFVRNAAPGDPAGVVPAGSYCLAPVVPDRVRVHVVQPTDNWTVINGPSTVPIAGSVAEVGSGLATVTMDAPMVVAATDQGLFLQIEDGAGELLLCAILAVDVVGNAYVVNMTDASMPAWVDAAGTSVATVLEPRSVVNGDFTFAPIGAPVGRMGNGVNGVAGPLNWAFGIRANNLDFGGSSVGATACIAHSDGAPAPDGDIWLNGHTGILGLWSYAVDGGDVVALDLSSAQLWGLCGATPAAGYMCGNSGQDVNVLSGSFNYWSGSALSNFGVRGESHCICSGMMAEDIMVSGGAWASFTNFRAIGENAVAALLTEDDGSSAEVQNFFLVGLVNGQRAFLEATEGSQIRVVSGTDIAKGAAVPADYPLYGYFANGGDILVEAGGVNDDIRGQYHTVAADLGGHLDIIGDIDLTTARPGGNHGGIDNADINVINESTLVLRGDILKGVQNTAASGCLNVDDGSHMTQYSGAFTVGVAPDDWTTRYGNNGLIHVADGSDARLGLISDGAVGVGAGIAIQVRRRSSLWYAANGGPLTGVANTKVGVAAAAAFPVAAVLNDLPAAPAGTEELCVIGPYALP
ncbi:MAG: hypothetical protein JXB32_24755 [Deltaproteobacteria bacterium]|nr:hypothetical protein [Deltaproteobacteria bacterium]